MFCFRISDKSGKQKKVQKRFLLLPNEKMVFSGCVSSKGLLQFIITETHAPNVRNKKNRSLMCRWRDVARFFSI